MSTSPKTSGLVPFSDTVTVRVREAAADGDVTIMLLRAGVSKGVGGPLNYSPELLIKEASKFDGIPVMDNHQTEREEIEKPYRSIREWLANTKDVVYDPTPLLDAPKGGLVGKLDFIEPWFEQRVRTRPDTIAFSIRASGQARTTVVSPTGTKVPDVESFSRVRSLDTVMKAGAGGKVLSIREAAREEMQMLLNDATPDQLREALNLKIRESKVVGDYYTSEDEKAWKRKMTSAKADGDLSKHNKLLDALPAGVEHDRSECPLCQGKGMTESKESEGETNMATVTIDTEALSVQIREALAPVTAELTRLQAELSAQRTKQAVDSLVEAKVAGSGLPKVHQEYLAAEIRESALPSDETERAQVIDRKIARFKSIAFSSAQGAVVSGAGATVVESKESEFEKAMTAKLHNPNIPPPSRMLVAGDVQSDAAKARRARREARKDNVIDATAV